MSLMPLENYIKHGAEFQISETFGAALVWESQILHHKAWNKLKDSSKAESKDVID